MFQARFKLVSHNELCTKNVGLVSQTVTPVCETRHECIKIFEIMISFDLVLCHNDGSCVRFICMPLS